MQDLKNLFEKVLPAAFGRFGASADPELIVYAASTVGAICRRVLEWKLDIHRAQLISEMARVKDLSSCFGDDIVARIEGLSQQVKDERASALAEPQDSRI